MVRFTQFYYRVSEIPQEEMPIWAKEAAMLRFKLFLAFALAFVSFFFLTGVAETNVAEPEAVSVSAAPSATACRIMVDGEEVAGEWMVTSQVYDDWGLWHIYQKRLAVVYHYCSYVSTGYISGTLFGREVREGTAVFHGFKDDGTVFPQGFDAYEFRSDEKWEDDGADASWYSSGEARWYPYQLVQEMEEYTYSWTVGNLYDFLATGAGSDWSCSYDVLTQGVVQTFECQ